MMHRTEYRMHIIFNRQDKTPGKLWSFFPHIKECWAVRQKIKGCKQIIKVLFSLLYVLVIFDVRAKLFCPGNPPKICLFFIILFEEILCVFFMPVLGIRQRNGTCNPSEKLLRLFDGLCLFILSHIMALENYYVRKDEEAK